VVASFSQYDISTAAKTANCFRASPSYNPTGWDLLFKKQLLPATLRTPPPKGQPSSEPFARGKTSGLPTSEQAAHRGRGRLDRLNLSP